MDKQRPTYRSDIKSWVLMAVGVFFLVNRLWAGAVTPHPSDDPLAAISDTTLQSGMEQISGILVIAGLMFVLVALVRLLWYRFVHQHWLTDQEVGQHYGIIARRVSTLQLDHIRNIEVDQTWWERLLGVGQLRISSAASEGQEVIWVGVPKPIQWRDAIRERKQANQTNQERAGEAA